MGQTVAFWLIKSEPSAYAWDDLVKDGRTSWDGVRNYQARNNLRAMRKGDLCLYYHSVSEKRIVGVARVVRESYADPTASDGDWSAVDVTPAFALENPVTLAGIKALPDLMEMALLRQSRLSVCPVKQAEYEAILELSETAPPARARTGRL